MFRSSNVVAAAPQRLAIDVPGGTTRCAARESSWIRANARLPRPATSSPRSRPARSASTTSQENLFELTRGSCAGRRFEDEITLFKSVGLPLEDLAAAKLALDTALI